jgi:hypothetical protein
MFEHCERVVGPMLPTPRPGPELPSEPHEARAAAHAVAAAVGPYDDPDQRQPSPLTMTLSGVIGHEGEHVCQHAAACTGG